MPSKLPVPVKDLNSLRLAFNNQQPIPIDDLGKLFTTLARDYRKQARGRTLVVVHVETGSLIAMLRDAAQCIGPYVENAVEIAKGIKSLSDFARTLSDLLARAKHRKASVSSRDSVGLKSAVALARLACDTKSDLQLSYSSADGEKFEFRLAHSESARVRDSLDQSSKVVRASALVDETAPHTLLPGSIRDPGNIATALITQRDVLRGASPSELVSLVKAFVAALGAAGLSYMLNEVATQLDGQGMNDVAAMLRREMASQVSRNNEPPLLT